MKVKMLLKYGVIGALLIAVVAVGLTSFNLPSTAINQISTFIGMVIFLILGVGLMRKAGKKQS